VVTTRQAGPRWMGVALAALLTWVVSSCGAGQRITPTLDATQVIEQRLPTLQAQMTGFAAQVTQNAPTVEAIMTLAATGPALIITPTPGTSPTSPAGGSGPIYDGGDGYVTTLIQAIAVGQTVNGTLATNVEGHNWTFEGAAGQSVTIRVVGSAGCDPRVKLIDPAGAVLGMDDDSGGGVNALLTATLPAAGMYTIRIDGWTAGGYTLTLQ